MDEVIGAFPSLIHWIFSFKSSSLVLLISFMNLIVAIKVFKFNKSNAFAKVSVIPVQHIKKENDDIHYINSTSDYCFYYDDNDLYRYGRRGYPIKKFTHEEVHWYFEVTNKSDVPALDVEINFSLRINFQWFWTTKDNENIEDVHDKIMDQKEIFQEFKIEYLAPQESKKVFITKLNGAFSHADLHLNILKSSDKVFINKSVKVDKYVHTKLNTPNDEYELVNLFASFGLNNIEMKKFLSPKEYDYFLKNYEGRS